MMMLMFVDEFMGFSRFSMKFDEDGEEEDTTEEK